MISNFVYLKIDPEKGIIGCYQLPNIEIERVESGSYPNVSGNDEGKERKLKFMWKNKELEFNSWRSNSSSQSYILTLR